MDEIIFTPDKTFVQYANGEDLEWQMCRLKIFCKEEKIILKISKNGMIIIFGEYNFPKKIYFSLMI